jgi:hypothetical protein
MDDQCCDPRAGCGRRVLLRAGLLVALVAETLLLAAMPSTTSAKKVPFTSFAEAFFTSTDAAGIQTNVQVTAIDRPTTSDTVTLEVTRSDPACADPDAGCPVVLLRGFVEAPVAEGEVRIQPTLRRARVAATIAFVDEISGTSCEATIDLTWHATGHFVPDGEDGSGFRKADAAGTVTCGDEEFLDGQVDSSAEISRFVLAG